MDVTKCTSMHCTYKSICYRQCSKPRTDGSEKYQSWMNFEYECNEENGFQYYIKSIYDELQAYKD